MRLQRFPGLSGLGMGVVEEGPLQCLGPNTIPARKGRPTEAIAESVCWHPAYTGAAACGGGRKRKAPGKVEITARSLPPVAGSQSCSPLFLTKGKHGPA